MVIKKRACLTLYFQESGRKGEMKEFLLSIDCSSGWTSLGLAEGGVGVGEINLRTGRRQSELLPVMVDFFLESFSLNVSDISLFSVAVGPGSFTGIKVGIAFTQFLAWADGKKTVPLSSLEILAQDGAAVNGGLVLPLLWAGGGKIYAALYRFEEGITFPEQSLPEGVYTPEEIAVRIDSMENNKEVLWLSDRPEKIEVLFGSSVPSSLRRGTSRGIAASVLSWKRRASACEPQNLLPRYLRNPDIG